MVTFNCSNCKALVRLKHPLHPPPTASVPLGVNDIYTLPSDCEKSVPFKVLPSATSKLAKDFLEFFPAPSCWFKGNDRLWTTIACHLVVTQVASWTSWALLVTTIAWGCHHLTCLNGEVMIFFPTLLFKINYSKIHVAYVTIKEVRMKCNVKPWDTAK